MQSVKPGRETSLVSFIFSLVAIIFGFVWMGVASSIGAGFFAIFGIVFILLGIISALWHLKNATSSKRFSIYEITDDENPSAVKYPFDNDPAERPNSALHKAYCPWCGGALENKQYVFCPLCGKRI
ncbi:zinc ribbon domain-containing protein [Candidatus Methanomassiliicoccus intestinalis]|uniref:zinc ribbon domain-containing protein n=1 Tax=Candidatus Methanomassiliicoccus intestinalis TaxID=1406512 RepID=UPI0037DDBF53